MSTEAGQELVIRSARKDDLPLIFEIFQDAFRLETPSESQLLGFHEQCPEGMLIAQIGDKVAGCTVAFIRNGRVHLYGTVACPEFRGHRGVGSGMAIAQQSNFQKMGYSELETIIRCDNVPSYKAAVKLGWKHVRTMHDFYSYPRRSARLYVKSTAEDGKLSVGGLTLRDKAKELWARRVEPRRGRHLEVAWFDGWHHVLDNALHELPEMEHCPHELFRLIMQNPSSTPKRIALVMKGDDPVAVIGLRKKGRHWLPAIQGIIPECIAPARDGYLFPALGALGVDVRISGSAAKPPMPARNAVAVPEYSIDCQGDFEKYWRESGYMKTIRLARNRTKTFSFEVDRPGSAALVVANWAEQWRDHPDQQTITASDLAVAAEYPGSRWHSFLLFDGDVPTAGLDCLVRGNDLAAIVMFRDKKYDWHCVGTRILDLAVQWAAEHGLARFEMGGWYTYKGKWAPQSGEHWDSRVSPLRQHLREQAMWKARAVPAKLRAIFGWLPGLSRTPGRESQEASELESEGTVPVQSPIAGASTGGDA